LEDNQQLVMSQSYREARRRDRRASSPPESRDRRRRRLDAFGQTDQNNHGSDWFGQQLMTPNPVAVQTSEQMYPSRVRAFLHGNPHLNSDRRDQIHHDMQELNALMRVRDAHHPAFIHSFASSATTDSLSAMARLNGPILTLDEIVSEHQPNDAAQPAHATVMMDVERVRRSLWHSSRMRGMSQRPTFNQLLTYNNNRDRLWANYQELRPHSFSVHPPVLLVYQLDRNSPQPVLRFLPFVPLSANKNSSTKNTHTPYMIQPCHKKRIDAAQSTARRAQWVPNKLPVELFELITRSLSRDDIKAMRLVSKEFELGVSRSLFDTVVVPFNTELYEMIEPKVVKRDVKGKRRADDPINNFVDPSPGTMMQPGTLSWKNTTQDTEDKLYRGHGLRVFEGFGGHIRRFGMSFEISEDALRDPPKKILLNQHESYFGSYDWPSQEYARFEQLAGLERTADETSQMKLAFSHLSKVQHLALSMDSGLGWMSGPDKSLRSLILQRPAPLFGCSHGIVDAQQQDRIRMWETLRSAYERADALDDLKEGCLERVNLERGFFQLPSFSTTPYADISSWATAPADAFASATARVSGDDCCDSTQLGVFRISDSDESTSAPEGDKFSPAALSSQQKEWLLETEWAQRAFLTTYMLAVVDNGPVFDKVSLLNFRISSRLVPLLSRHDFWAGLPTLQDVTLAVIPDWRTVERGEAGDVETRGIDPSSAAEKTFILIQDFIAIRPEITKLSFSWAAGGEHAEGSCARNHHILPAPLTTIDNMSIMWPEEEHLINLPYIKHLVLSNCWFTPDAIVAVVKKLRRGALRKLKFDSVSLTAMSSNTNDGIVNAVAGAQGPGNAVLVGPFAAHLGAYVWQGPPPGVMVQHWAQTMLQNLNLVTQQQGIVLAQVPHVWTNHPMGMTMQMISAMLTALSTGGGQSAHPMAQPGTLYQLRQLSQPIAPGTHQNAAQLPQAPLPVGPAAHPFQQPATQGPLPSNIPWYENHRAGSWVKVIDKISPGPRLEMYAPRGEFDSKPEKRKKGLVSIEFNSCGYVQLRSTSFDQHVLEAPASYRMSRQFTRRQNSLTSSMLPTSDRLLGTIVQYMPERESDALHHAWNMTMGWSDTKLAEEAEYDGYLAGGTGRFSGSVTRDSEILEAYSANHV
jgi:hypothetical protein